MLLLKQALTSHRPQSSRPRTKFTSAQGGGSQQIERVLCAFSIPGQDARHRQSGSHALRYLRRITMIDNPRLIRRQVNALDNLNVK